jgi:hypothetical protein
MDDEATRLAWIRDRINRFGLTTAEDVGRCPAFDIGANGIQKWLAKRVENGTLATFPLVGRQFYFVHGREGVRQLGLPPRRAKALGPQALATAFGTLEFCAMKGFVKLTAGEFRAQFPTLQSRGLPASAYFLQTGDICRVGLVVVDLGAQARRLAKKVQRLILRRDELLPFRSVMLEGSFTVGVVTATDGKSRQIRNALRRQSPRPDEDLFDAVEVVVEVVPSLLSLLVSEA